MGGFLGIVRVALALFLFPFAFATLSVLAGLISGLLTLLVVPLLLVREVGVTTLPLYCGELVGMLLVVSSFATGGLSFVLCKDSFAHSGEGVCCQRL